jgi:hypothetical protein
VCPEPTTVLSVEIAKQVALDGAQATVERFSLQSGLNCAIHHRIAAMALALDPQRLAPVALMFRPAFLERAVTGRHRGMVSEIAKNIGFKREFLQRPLSLVLDDFYKLLVKHYRCEYVFKNAVAASVRSQNRGFNNIVVLDEFRASECRVDVAVVNGTSVAYEIKTDLDSLDKLPRQLNAYQRIFDETWIVTTPALSDSAKIVAPSHVGIATLGANLRLKTVRDCTPNNEHVSPEHIFDCMRREEYVAALKRFTGVTPAVPPARMYTECKRIFCDLAPTSAHTAFVSAIKSRTAKSLLAAHGAIPPSLTYLCLTTTGTSKTMQAIASALDAPCA